MLQTVRPIARLAIEGGTPVRSRPFPGWPAFGREEIQAMTRVLRSGKVNYWTGEEGRRFEAEFAAVCGCRYGVVVANGTVALELALHAVGIGPGDEVIVPCRTFIASASCVVMRGAIPVMADVDPVSQNLTADTVRSVLTPRTRAIIAVHLAGWPCAMDSILELARQHNLKVIEDCAQCHGAAYKRQPAGSFGDLAAYSFCQDKIMTTGGEGGMLLTNDEGLWRRAWSYKDHGKDYDLAKAPKKHSGFHWLHTSFGTNWRLTEVQSALGRVLLPKLPAWVEQRRAYAALLNERFMRLPALRVTLPDEHTYHSYYKYYVFVQPEMLKEGWDRDRIMRAIVAEGIPCGSGICGEIYRERAFAAFPRPAEGLPVASQLAHTSLMFLVHPTLRPADIKDIYRAVEKVMRAATR